MGVDIVGEAATSILARMRQRPAPAIGLILGTGLGAVAEALAESDVIPYASIPYFPRPAVVGHAGELCIGSMAGWTVAAMRGRPHFYEGFSMAEISLPVRVLHALGCHILIVTNAAGGLNPSFAAGDLILIRDHLNFPALAGFNPLAGTITGSETARAASDTASRFICMTQAYDLQLRTLAHRAARLANIAVGEGIYAMVGGPSYETEAELRLLRSAGADAIGMSTAPEVIVARHCSMRVLGISCIANVVASASFTESAPPVSASAGAESNAKELSHLGVLAQCQAAAPRLASLLSQFLQLLWQESRTDAS